MIVDPLPAELDFAPADPLRRTPSPITQPAGAPEPPEPVFTPTQDDGGRVSSLRWPFPGWDLLPGAVR